MTEYVVKNARACYDITNLKREGRTAMKMEWMGRHREVVEALIHYCNIYAGVYKREEMVYQGISYSYSQVQVLEYLLENEERRDNMSAIAARLGISRSNFTKIVNRLEAKGLVEKHFVGDSKKELTVTVNQLGRTLYEEYYHQILKYHFRKMFHSLEKIPAEYYPYIAAGLRDANCEEPAEDHEEE